MDTCALEHLGKWALVHDGELVGVFDGFEGAADNSENRERAIPYPKAQFPNRMHDLSIALARHVRGEALSSSTCWNHRR